MKLLRRFLISLGLLLALLAGLFAAAFIPSLQTWFVQSKLAEQPGFHGSLGSLAAGLNTVDITDLRFEVRGALVTLPTLQAKLSLATATLDRKILIRSLVAKGWTIDLTRRAEVEEARLGAVGSPANGGKTDVETQATTEAARNAAEMLLGAASRWGLPGDFTVDGVELEGDVLVAVSEGTPVRVHVVITGGGMASGHEGTFVVEASAESPWTRIATATAHGRLLVAMDTPRTIDSVAVRADLTAKGEAIPDDIRLTLEAGAKRGPAEETYTVGLSSGPRQLANLVVRRPYATGRRTGTWSLDVRDTDWAPFFLERQFPAIAAAGDGHFDADPDLTKIKVVGRLNTTANRLEVVAPKLDRLGAVGLTAKFDAEISGQRLRLNDLAITLVGDGATAALRSLQPFDFDPHSGGIKATNEASDWIEGSLQGLPSTWISGVAKPITFTARDAKGKFVVRAADGGFTLRTKGPLTATGVWVSRSAGTTGPGFDVGLSLLANYGPRGWQVELSPGAVGAEGKKLGTIEGKVSRRAGADQAIAIVGKWTADLKTWATTRLASPGLAQFNAQTASGDFSASVGEVSQVIGKLTVAGRDSNHAFTADVTADIDSSGLVEIQMPLKLTVGSVISEMLAEGTWSGGRAGDRITARLTGQKISLHHLQRLAAPLAAATGLTKAIDRIAAPGQAPQSVSEPDREPFWGSCVGTVTVAFDQVNAGDKAFKNVGGSLDLNHDSLRLERGRWGLLPQGALRAEGVISFDPAARSPYGLKATAEIDEIDADYFFGSVPPGQDAIIEGKFALAGTIASDGANLADLADRAREEFRLTSKRGIIRLLSTQIYEAVPEEKPSAVSDTLITMGSFMGKLLKVKGGIGSGEKKVSPATEAMLTFASRVAEIGYEQIVVTAIRESDRSLRLADIRMTSPDVTLTGSGLITGGGGRSFRGQPIGLELRLGAHGSIADLLANTGLPSGKKDSAGWVQLDAPIHFGGTLERIDVQAWHDMLVKAAVQKPTVK